MTIVSRYISGYVRDPHDTSRVWIISNRHDTSRIEFCQKATWHSRIIIENSSPTKISFAFWPFCRIELSCTLESRLPNDFPLISSNFQAAWGFVSPSVICLSEFTHPEKLNPLSNRCLIAVTSMGVRLSVRFLVEDSLLSRAFVLFLKNWFHITQAFPRVQEQSEKHLGEF